MVLVGAIIVRSMVTVWHGMVSPKCTDTTSQWIYTGRGIGLRKGEEMGCFLLDSTVIMLFRQGAIRFNDDWLPARKVRLSRIIGRRVGWNLPFYS